VANKAKDRQKKNKPHTWLVGELRSLTNGNKNRVKNKRARASKQEQRRKNKGLPVFKKKRVA